jgi:AraC-like DNA-binding protein
MVHGDMFLYGYGLDTPHDPSFVVDRPSPRKAWVISCFGTSVQVRTRHGLEIGSPGDCFIVDPYFYEWYTTMPGSDTGYRNDWMHIESTSIEYIVRDLHIPLNVLIPTGDPHLISDILEEIDEEFEYRPAHWKEAVSLAIQKALLRISRVNAMNAVNDSLSFSDFQHKIKFQKIREAMMHRSSEKWTVTELAKAANLSASRFQVLYQKFFNIGPIEDLIWCRLSNVCERLITTDATLDTIASECGFTDAAYLSRAFSKRLGCAPGAYRHMKEQSRPLDASGTPFSNLFAAAPNNPRRLAQLKSLRA